MSEVKRGKKVSMTEGRNPLFRRRNIAFHFPIEISIFPLAMGMPRRESSWQSLLARYTSSVSLMSCHRRANVIVPVEWRRKIIIDCRKVETSSTSLNIHITRFFLQPFARSGCGPKLYFTKRAGRFMSLLDFFLFVSFFCCSSHSLVLHTVSSSTLLSASNEGNR